MSTSARKTSEKKPSQKQNKNIEINMSTLSTAQKQMCIKLLAQSNINFEEDKHKDCFEAQLKIDPLKLTSEFTIQKQTQPNVSPIKKRAKQQVNKMTKIQPKQNIPISANIKHNPHLKQKIRKKSTNPHPIYTSSKKTLCKTVKLNSLKELQKLHPFVELYVYPKKMSFQNLIQLIEQIYDLYWNVQIQGNKSKPKQQQHSFSFDNKLSNAKQNQTKNPKNTIKTKSIMQTQIPQTQSKQQNKKTFCSWVYQHFILIQKQKMKIQQLLVNLVESLNHFSYKHLGIQMFYNFLAGTYNLETLNYYLVVRALLQQIQGQKIIEKVSSYGLKAGILYKMKLNPYNKFIEEEKVYDFLDVCCQSSGNSQKHEETVDKMFQQMTQQMFFDEKKKKNYIHFFEMAQILLRQFLKIDTVNTTNLQLSCTQGNSTLTDFLFNQQMNYMVSPDKNFQNDLELTFQVHQEESVQQSLQKNTYADDELNDYLPNYDLQQLQMKPESISSKPSFQSLLYEQLYKKYESICKQLSKQIFENSQQLLSKQILQILFQSVIKGQKNRWIEFMRSKGVKSQRQSQQLYFIEKLQIQYSKLKNAKIISNDFIRKMLTVPYLRQAIVKEAGVNFLNP